MQTPIVAKPTEKARTTLRYIQWEFAFLSNSFWIQRKKTIVIPIKIKIVLAFNYSFGLAYILYHIKFLNSTYFYRNEK